MKTRIGHIQNPENVRKITHAFQHSMKMSKEHVELIAEEVARWDVLSKDFLKKPQRGSYEKNNSTDHGSLSFLRKS